MCSLEILIHGSSITRKDTTNPMHESCMEPDVDLLPNVPYIYIYILYIYIYIHIFSGCQIFVITKLSKIIKMSIYGVQIVRKM